MRQLFYRYYPQILYCSMDWCTYATIVLSILVTYFIDLWTGEPMRQLFYQYYPHTMDWCTYATIVLSILHTLLIYGLVNPCDNCSINISLVFY